MSRSLRICIGVFGFFLFVSPLLAQNKNITLLSSRAGGTRGGWGYTDSLGREFALVCRGNALDVVNITNPASPVLARTIAISAGGSDLKQVRTYQRWAYAVNQGGGANRAALQIINLSNPFTATTVGQYPGSLPANATAPNGAHTVHIDGDYAYLGMNGAAANWWIVSLAIPTAPVQVSNVAPGPGTGTVQSHDSYIKGNLGYVACLGGGFSIFDISNKAVPQRLSDVLYPGAFTHNTWTTEDGNFLFTTDETAGGHLRVWDVRNPSTPAEVGSYSALPGIVHNVFVKGTYAYVSYYTEGVKILDIEDPTYPIEVGSYDTYPQGSSSSFNGCWDVYPYFNSGVITAYDLTNGLLVLSFNNATAGKIVGQVTEQGSGRVIPDAQVRIIEVDKSTRTDADGYYSIRTVDGLRQVEASRFGFVSDTFPVNAILSNNVTLNVALAPLPRGTLTGSVNVSSQVASAPPSLSGIRVGLGGDDFFSDTTDASGNFSLELPAGAPLTVLAGRWGLVTKTETFTLSPGQTVNRNYQLSVGYFDQFELDQGWTVGDPSDDAVSGIWELAVPIASFNGGGFQSQTGADHTPAPGQSCYITGQAMPNQSYQEHDVDGGRTTLYAPPMDLSDHINPVLSYWRWFANSGGANPSQDTIVAELSNDGGASWVVLERFRFNQNSWTQRQFNVQSFLPLTGNMRFRISISDRQGDSNVEGGMDDFMVSGAPSFRGDLDGNGFADAGDVIILLNAVFLGNPMLSPAQADFNNDCLVDASDVVVFLNFVFLGIPLGPACGSP